VQVEADIVSQDVHKR